MELVVCFCSMGSTGHWTGPACLSSLPSSHLEHAWRWHIHSPQYRQSASPVSGGRCLSAGFWRISSGFPIIQENRRCCLTGGKIPASCQHGKIELQFRLILLLNVFRSLLQSLQHGFHPRLTRHMAGIFNHATMQTYIMGRFYFLFDNSCRRHNIRITL